jgi:hypothetical protein
MIIDVIDMEDPELGRDRRGQLDRLGARSLKLVMYGMSNGVGQMVRDVAARVPAGRLQVLRIWSHGRSGGQTISGGHGGEAYRVAHWTGISVANLDALRPTLSILTPLFAPNGRVELRGCEVASGEDGQNLLLALAGIWRVPVLAGIATQYRAEWDGTVVQASPSGGLMCAGPSPIN